MARTIRYTNRLPTRLVPLLGSGTGGIPLAGAWCSAAIAAAWVAWASTTPTAGIVARIVVLYLANARG